MEFPIAFALMVHDQITLFETLLATLFRPQNAYCIFMDSKADPGFKTIVNQLINCYKENFPNVNEQHEFSCFFGLHFTGIFFSQKKIAIRFIFSSFCLPESRDGEPNLNELN